MLISSIFVGGFPNGGSRAFLPVSFAELMRSQSMIERTLRTFNFAHGRFVLLISFLDDGAYAIPFERAIMSLGLLATNADKSPYEASRIESICRRFDVAAVAGVTSEVLNGLQDAGHSLQKLFGQRVVWAFPGAYERLTEIPGITLCRLLEVGPALGVECSERAGVHIDANEWNCEEHDGELLLTSRLLRAVDFASYRTSVRGTVITAICACGSTDVRVLASD
jgi:hypothetical protein